MVEFDVQLSKDKIPVIYHDFELATTSLGKNGENKELIPTQFNSLTLAQLRGLKVFTSFHQTFQMFFRSCLNTWYYDYNMNFSKCSAQSRVINSLTLHLGVSQMQNRLSDAAKTNPSPEGGPLNFGPRFERKKNRRR